MKTKDAYEYVIRVAKSWGYTDNMISAFKHEVYERLNMMEDTSKEALDELLEEIF